MDDVLHDERLIAFDEVIKRRPPEMRDKGRDAERSEADHHGDRRHANDSLEERGDAAIHAGPSVPRGPVDFQSPKA
jgi:hypothetical protein